MTEPTTKSIRASLPLDLWNSVHILAFERRQNIQALVQDALRHYIGCEHRDEAVAQVEAQPYLKVGWQPRLYTRDEVTIYWLSTPPARPSGGK